MQTSAEEEVCFSSDFDAESFRFMLSMGDAVQKHCCANSYVWVLDQCLEVRDLFGQVLHSEILPFGVKGPVCVPKQVLNISLCLILSGTLEEIQMCSFSVVALLYNKC